MQQEMVEKFGALITAAFGLVAALAWNEAIKKLFESVFGTADQLTAMFLYAILVTVIAVLATVWIGSLAKRAGELTEQAETRLVRVGRRRQRA